MLLLTWKRKQGKAPSAKELPAGSRALELGGVLRSLPSQPFSDSITKGKEERKSLLQRAIPFIYVHPLNLRAEKSKEQVQEQRLQLRWAVVSHWISLLKAPEYCLTELLIPLGIYLFSSYFGE